MSSTATLTRSGSAPTGFAHTDRSSTAPATGVRGPSRIVTVVNLSRYDLTLVGYAGVESGHRLPPLSTRLAPNDYLELGVAAPPTGQDLTAHFDVVLPDGSALPDAYRLTIGSDPGRTDKPSAVPGSPIDELHLTQDDILLRNATSYSAMERG